MEMNPIFSIVVPIYKVNPEYLGVCINSILKQTYEDFELILVDDGSPDDCGQICDTYAAQDCRIKVIHQKNQGVSVARNSGIASAKGEWILFVDADDWIEVDALAQLSSHLSKNEYDILLFHAVREREHVSEEMIYGLETDCLFDLTQYYNKELFYRRVMQVPHKKTPIYYSWDKVYRRSFLIENELTYAVGLAKSEDKAFIAQCFEKARCIYHIDAVLYHYRMNEESVCHRFSTNMDVQRRMLAKLLKQIADRMDEELGKMCNNDAYRKITDDYTRFMFGIISDVLLLQYYHPDNPNRKNRRKEAVEFLESEPFKSVINEVSYKELSAVVKLKKFLLQHHMVGLFCWVKRP